MKPTKESAVALDASDLRICVVVSRYHCEVTDTLRKGAIEAFRAAGGQSRNLRVLEAPGSWELVAIAHAAASDADEAFDAIVALGCIIKGETSHDQHLIRAVIDGLMELCLSGATVTLGVLTCDNIEQARARAGGDSGNKGEEAMNAAIEVARTIRSLRGEEALD